MAHFSHIAAFYYGGFINLGIAGHSVMSGCYLDASRDAWESSIDRRCYPD